MSGPTVVVAPDAFKGCLSSVAVGAALAAGVTRARPDAQLVQRPLADGGDGTLAALATAEKGVERSRGVVGPQFEALQAGWWSPDVGPPVVAMARASGLAVTRHRNPLRATSFGTGQLVAAALDAHGAVWVGCGGSATVDGGAGCLRALGFEFLDSTGQPLDHGGSALVHLAKIVPPETLPGGEIVALHDVTNPLVGFDGAAAVYGPQKGADADGVVWLEAALDRFGAVCAETFGRDPRTVVGGGAAGGLAGGLYAALGAELRPGFDAIAERVGLDAALADADLVLTGEGRLDDQTAFGKTVSGVVKRAAARDLKVWAFAGHLTESAERWAPDHVALWPIADGPRSLDDSISSAWHLIERAAWRAMRAAGPR